MRRLAGRIILLFLLALAVPVRADQVSLTYENPDAEFVTITGSFNEWNTQSHPLVRNPQGVWTITLELEPGEYEYKFVIDGGSWVADPKAPIAAGSQMANSLLQIGGSTPPDLCRFEYDKAGADTVYLSGEFNGWSETAMPMLRLAPDRWALSLPLPTGLYRYVIRANGMAVGGANDVWEQPSEHTEQSVKFHLAPSRFATVRYRLRLTAPFASSVCAVGEFNRWNQTSHPLADPDGDGVWELELSLKPGIYQYKFIVDKVEWIPDPEADGYIQDGNGNSVMIADALLRENRSAVRDSAVFARLSPATRYMYFCERAFAFTVLGRYEEAREAARHAFLWAMSLDPVSVSMALWRAARAEFEMGNDSEALRLLRLAQKTCPQASSPMHDEIFVKMSTLSEMSSSGFAPVIMGGLKTQIEIGRSTKQRSFFREQTSSQWGGDWEGYLLASWLDHSLGSDSSAWQSLEWAWRGSAGSAALWIPPAAHYYAGLLARDLGESMTAVLLFDSALHYNPYHEFARFYRERPVKAEPIPQGPEIPGFYFLGVRQRGRRWEQLGQEEAITEIVREKVERSGLIRWVDADDLRTYAIELGVPFSRASESERFFSEYAAARNVPLVGELHVTHEGHAMLCRLRLGGVDDLRFREFTVSLDDAAVESVAFRSQGLRKFDDMAERVRDELLTRVRVEAEILSTAQGFANLGIGEGQGVTEGAVFEVERPARVMIDPETGESMTLSAKRARLRIVELHPKVSRAKVVRISKGFELKPGMKARLLSGKSEMPAEDEATSTERGKVQIADLRFEPIFPVSSRSYTANAFGRIRLRNKGDRSLSNLKVTFEIPGLTDGAAEFREDRVREGSEITIPVTATFSDALMQVLSGTDRQATVEVSWDFGAARRVEQRKVPVKVMGRNALIWRDEDMVGAFANPKDPSIIAYRSQILSKAVEDYPFLDPALAKAIVIFESLRRIQYVSDPLAPFVGIDTQAWDEDYIQFPMETLKLQTGDCDDMAVLYATLLQSVGVPARFVLVPGHIFVHFKTGIAAGDWQKLGIAQENLILNEGAIWLPIETTMFKHGFMQALEKGAEESRGSVLACVPLDEAWQRFSPVLCPAEPVAADVTLAWNGYRGIVDGIKKRQDDFVEREFRVALRENPGDTLAQKALGMYLWQAGRYDEAAQVYGEAQTLAENDGEVNLVLGALAMRRGDAVAAQSNFMAAGSRLPGDARPSFNLAVLWASQNRLAEARQAFATAVARDPALAAHESALFGSQQAATGEAPAPWRLTLIRPAAAVETPERDRVFQRRRR